MEGMLDGLVKGMRQGWGSCLTQRNTVTDVLLITPDAMYAGIDKPHLPKDNSGKTAPKAVVE